MPKEGGLPTIREDRETLLNYRRLAEDARNRGDEGRAVAYERIAVIAEAIIRDLGGIAKEKTKP
ncbi:MAG TPA: hypothetical protein VI957_01985 [Candidatus Paceibacterota bacterium]